MRRRGDLQRSLPAMHDTGMVTLISQDLSEFALHVRAFLGLPVGAIRQYGPAASAVILPQLSSQNVSFGQLQSAVGAGLQLRLFGKPEIDGTRRLGVTLAVADSVEKRPWRGLKPPPRRSSSKGKDKKTRSRCRRPGC